MNILPSQCSVIEWKLKTDETVESARKYTTAKSVKTREVIKRTTEYGWSTKVGVTVVFCRAHCSRRTTFWVSLPTNCSYVKIARRSKKIGVTKTFETHLYLFIRIQTSVCDRPASREWRDASVSNRRCQQCWCQPFCSEETRRLTSNRYTPQRAAETHIQPTIKLSLWHSIVPRPNILWMCFVGQVRNVSWPGLLQYNRMVPNVRIRRIFLVHDRIQLRNAPCPEKINPPYNFVNGYRSV